ncbi:MAG: hypothetical protein R6U35_02840, partial [Candidatus Humimicrobiaceae bacterium]
EKSTVGDMVKNILKLTGGKLLLPFGIPPFLMYPLAAVVEFMFKALRKEPPFSRRSLLFFLNNYLYDISKAKKELGYNPTISLEEGLKKTYGWIIENGKLYK